MTIACYVRVSTRRQKDDSQRAEIEKWLDANGIERSQVKWYAQTAFIDINADHSASSAHNCCHGKGNSPDPAAHVQAVHSLTQAAFVQQGFGGGPFHGG